MPKQGDLTNLPAVKDWLNTSGQAYPPGSDTKLGDLITRASRFVENYCSRPFTPLTHTEVRDGTGTDALFLRHRPIVSVASVTIGTTSVPPSPQGSYAYGFTNDSDQVFLVCGTFPPFRQNVKVVYTAGFQATASITVPTAGGLFPVGELFGSTKGGTPAGTWNFDSGVTYAGGAALTLVSANPGQGQYAVAAQPDGTWAYTFSAADAGAALTVLYGYTPEDLEQAVIELVGERFKTRNRIGETSQHTGQSQTVSFSQKDFNDFIRTTLNNFTDVVPV